MSKRKRFCRICLQPEKKYIFGYSNLTPYSEICTECLNRALKALEERKTWTKT